MVGWNIHKNPWLIAHFKPVVLSLPHHLRNLPKGYLKVLPNFNGENGVSAKELLSAFQVCTDNFYVKEDNIFS